MLEKLPYDRFSLFSMSHILVCRSFGLVFSNFSPCHLFELQVVLYKSLQQLSVKFLNAVKENSAAFNYLIEGLMYFYYHCSSHRFLYCRLDGGRRLKAIYIRDRAKQTETHCRCHSQDSAAFEGIAPKISSLSSLF